MIKRGVVAQGIQADKDMKEQGKLKNKLVQTVVDASVTVKDKNKDTKKLKTNK